MHSDIIQRALGKHAKPMKPTEDESFAQCECVTASPHSPVHLRKVAPDEPLRLSGGIPEGTQALCGRSVEHGWDLKERIGVEQVRREKTASPRRAIGRTCERCIAVALEGDVS